MAATRDILRIADKLWPVVIIASRHGGWVAIAEADTPVRMLNIDPCRAEFCMDDGPNSEEDEEAKHFWKQPDNDWAAHGETPDQALERLVARSIV